MNQHHDSTSAMITFSPTHSSSPIIIIISPAPSSPLELMTILSQLSPYLVDGELHEADTIENSADHSEVRRPASPIMLVASSEDHSHLEAISRNPLLAPKEKECKEHDQSCPVPTNTATLGGLSKMLALEEKESNEHESSRFVPKIVKKSDPVKIPGVPKKKSRDESEGKFVPPHLIIARRWSSPFSVLEGAGRTLKGRDLIQFRNDVWRKTGFLQV